VHWLDNKVIDLLEGSLAGQKQRDITVTSHNC